RLHVHALAGGNVNWSGLTQVGEPSSGDARFRDVNINADGTGSLVDVSKLTSFVDAFGSVTQAGQGYGGTFSSLTATSGGTIDARKLASTQNVALTFNTSGTLKTPSLATVTGGELAVSGAAVTLDKVTN